MVTFWIASSSTPEGKAAVRALARKLNERGWQWVHGFDWTEVANLERTEEEVQRNIRKDYNGACFADVFIFLNGPWNTSKGANVELGARRGKGYSAVYIDNGAGESDYFFYKEEGIQSYETVEEFLSAK